MSLSGSTTLSEVLPLVTYLENPEQTVIKPEAHHIAHIVLNSFQDISELTASLLRAADEEAPYQYQVELPLYIKENQHELLIKVARITQLLRHVFRMYDIEHPVVRELLMFISQEQKKINTPDMVLALQANYQRLLQTYRQACHRDLQKANIWFALLKQVMPAAKTVFPDEEFAGFKNDMIFDLCAEIFDPCTHLIQRVIAGETLNADTFNDYCVIAEKIKWVLEFLPTYINEHLSRLNIPFPQNAVSRTGRLQVERNRVKSLLFFLYQSRIFLSLTGKLTEASTVARLFKQFLKDFNTATADEQIYTDDLRSALRDTIKPFQESMLSLDQRKSKSISIALFESISRRQRMQTFHKLEQFYKSKWIGINKSRKAIKDEQIIAKCNHFRNQFERAKQANRLLQRFDELMALFIEILTLYLCFELTIDGDEVLDVMYEAFNYASALNAQHEKEDVIAVSLIRGIIEKMLDDLKGEHLALELADESAVDDVTDELSGLQLEPALIFSPVYKTDKAEASRQEPQPPIIEQRKGTVFDL